MYDSGSISQLSANIHRSGTSAFSNCATSGATSEGDSQFLFTSPSGAGDFVVFNFGSITSIQRIVQY